MDQRGLGPVAELSSWPAVPAAVGGKTTPATFAWWEKGGNPRGGTVVGDDRATQAFPIGLLQMSIKLTNEPPQGIRASLVRTYSWLSQDYLEMFRRPEWKPMLFTQCFLHSVVVERRKFGPIGFSVPYEFNQGDWTASVQFLINHMTTIGENLKNPVNRDTVCYMVAEIQYGGRITDNNDRALFRAITEFLYDLRITNPDRVRDAKLLGTGNNTNRTSHNANTGGERMEFSSGYASLFLTISINTGVYSGNIPRCGRDRSFPDAFPTRILRTAHVRPRRHSPPSLTSSRATPS
ncbi:putative dynein heavy chain [Trypanosoma cruzi]|uniref:Putative dynein heavy chain n=1 Tax=Trypanosoma cruzi TaxID=5693 RepID=A0A2V2WAH9_TRYCR|nr:putative dynein heavy chain [Trypanosoma cruzi]